MAATDIERPSVGKYVTNDHLRDALPGSSDVENLHGKGIKRYPLASWMAVLLLILVVGMYILSFCLKQNGFQVVTNFKSIIVQRRSCQDPGVPASEISYVHYPEPLTYSRAECACTAVRFFAILSMQRSGSGWFETLLNSHMNISSNGEIFSVKDRRSNVSSIIATLDKVYNLDWLSSASKNECTSAVGLKWMLNQGLIQHHQQIVEYMNRRKVFVVFLFRRNLLRRYISILANEHDRNTKQLNGTHKAHVHSTAEADVLAQYKPTIDTKVLLAELKRSDKLRLDGMRNFNSTRHIVLYYEDLVSNHTKLMDVLTFLRLPRRELSSRHVKIHRSTLADHIENWDAVYKALNGTEFASFLRYRR